MIKKIIKKIRNAKLVDGEKYYDLLKCFDEMLNNNYELRKVCQCRECRWYSINYCINELSNNSREFMNPYGSCEKCERR